MKTIRFTAVLVLAFAVFALTGNAQRKTKPKAAPTPKPTPTRITANPVVSAAKQQVSNQLYNVNVFVEKIGPVAVAIEAADRDAASGRLDRDSASANDKNKQKVIAAIRGLRAGLVTLESDFRTKPLLAQFLPKIQGISTLAGESEDKAIAGKFVAAKDPLRDIALKLNDTLTVMPGQLAAGSATPTPIIRNVSNTTTSGGGTASSNASSGARRDPAVGMTADEVTQSTWGVPTNKRTSTTSNGKTEVWTYSGKGTIYFFNGKVTQVLR